MTEGTRRTSFYAFNLGIVVSSIYAALLGILLLAEVVPRFELDVWHTVALFGVVGVIAGSIGAFSNTAYGVDARRDLIRNVYDGAMIIVWTWIAVLATNLAAAMAPAVDALRACGAFAGGVATGALIGEPVLRWMARTSIKGSRPFLFVNHMTSGIRRPETQLVARVLIQTMLAASLLVLAFVAIVVVLVLAAIAVALFILGRVLDDGDGSRVVTVRERRAAPRPRRGESREVEGLFGNYTEHHDDDGRKTGESREVEGLFGNYTEHRDARGQKTGESREVDGLFGKHTEHRDGDGRKTGESREVDGLFGTYTEHRDADGRKTGESREVDGLFGKYTQHTEED